MEFRVFDFGVELIHRNNLHRVVRRNQQIEIERIVNRRFDNMNQSLSVNLMRSEMVVMDTDLSFPFDEILFFTIYENSTDQVAFIGTTVVFERVG